MNEALVDLAGEALLAPVATANAAEEAAFLARLRDGVIGHDSRIETPEGGRPLVYFDYTASGRFHRAVEDALNSEVLPYMANTHTETSATGRLMTHLYERSLRRAGRYLNAGPGDVVLPVGSGSTGAVNRLIQVMGMRLPSQLEDRWRLSDHIPADQRPVVFRSRMEHHSNDISWRETIAETVYVPFDPHGRVSPEHLDALLSGYAARARRGCWSRTARCSRTACRSSPAAARCSTPRPTSTST